MAGNGAKDGTPINDINRLTNQYGGNAEDWSKVTSQSKDFGKGETQQIHAYVNQKTGEVVEPKIKIQESKIQGKE